jgi:putative nucleotidyltransferase with HDIG domain
MLKPMSTGRATGEEQSFNGSDQKSKFIIQRKFMWTISDRKEWSALYERFNWVRDMRGVLQDKVHHAEGDVETHTRMVIEALERLQGYQQLNEQDREILWAAALLHDVEKRSTTIYNEDGSISSPGHAKKGAATTRALLYRNIPAPFHIREAVVKLVRYHGLPLWVFHKPDPAKALIAASLSVNTYHLSLLAEADVLGRISADRNDLLYRVEMFRELCKEHGVYGEAKRFPSSLGKMNYFRKEEASADYLPFDDTTCEVIMLSGLPGAGKDNYIRKKLRDWPVVSIDEIRRRHKIAPTDKKGNGRAIQMAKEEARVYLRSRTSFVWNATNITRSMREQLIDLLLTYKGKVTIVYIEVPYVKLKSQNRERDYVVPMGAMEKLIDKLEVPSPEEAHEVVYHIDD